MPHFADDARYLFDEWIDLGCPIWFLPEGEHLITVTGRQVCELLLRCSDVVPYDVFNEACKYGVHPRRRTYASLAREFLRVVVAQQEATR